MPDSIDSTRLAFVPRLLLGAGLALLTAAPAVAGHHQWIISELFSNADGTVQFVELLGTADNEQGIGGFSVATLGPEGSVASSASLAPNLPNGNTAGAYLLVATAGYATLAAQQGAPAPDRVLPDDFLELGGDRVRYAGIGGTDRAYGAGGLPTDGVLSLDYESGSPGTTPNTPQNFAGQVGQIDASVPVPTSVPTLSRMGIVGLIGIAVIAMAFWLRREPVIGAAA